MPTHIRAQMACGGDTPLPKDFITNTVYFTHSLELIEGAPDWDTLADDLLGVAAQWYCDLTFDRFRGVKLYDMADEEPRPVKAEKTASATSFPASSVPREVAVCLSFHGGRNIPTQRGRIYLPAFTLSNQLAGRPSSGIRDKAMTFARGLRDLGGVNVDWCVHSVKKNAYYPVKYAWCDDEWDTVRSRGLKSTTRTWMDLDE